MIVNALNSDNKDKGKDIEKEENKHHMKVSFLLSMNGCIKYTTVIE